MENQKSQELKQSLRAKSPTIKSALLDCSVLSIPNPRDLNPIMKENQETEVLTVSTPSVHPPNNLKHLSLFSNLQSTPNTRQLNKPEMDSRIIMNLSPIISTSSLKTNLYNHKDIFQHKSHAEIDFSLNPLKYRNSSNLCKKHESDKRKTNKTLIGPSHKNIIIDSPIVPDNTRRTNEDNVNEKAKRCLFEKEKAISMSNLETDQDSLNISLDILEQVCQMSEIMDDSLTEEIKISIDTDKKRKKLASFLYGNSTTKLDDTEEENKLLQLALSMEDNVLTDSRLKKKLYFEGEFTSLNQLKNNETNLSKNDSEQSKISRLNTCISDSKCNFLDSEEMNPIGNTQMCEIADITEPLESFDDQWTQQYTSNLSNLSNKSKNNNSNKDYDAVMSTPIDFIDHKVNIIKSNPLKDNSNKRLKIFDELNESPIMTQDDTLTNEYLCKSLSTAGGKSIEISDKAVQKVQTMLKDELNESSIITQENIIMNPNKLCKGFSTAGGKSIEISDKAVQKVQTMLKDELNESSIITQENIILNPNKLCRGFSTAGGKSIKISDKAVQKVQTMLKDELNKSSIITQENIIINPNKLCKGFSTAGGKSIKISDKAVQKVQTMLKDELNESSIITQENININPNKLCKGFSTAGGKSIKISDKAVQKVQTMLKDELNESSTITQENIILNPNKLCRGFSTAGGKSIEISDKAVQKVQTMLKDELNESSIITQENIILNPNKLCKGFSTAGGKSIKISDKAVQKVQTMLKDELNESSTITQENIILNPNKLCRGFSTAGGKSIEISDKAVQKVQTMLKDELNESSIITQENIILNPNKLCKGFSTAGGKSIKISDKAVQKVQTMLKDELNESSTITQENIILNPNKLCRGFSTAGGKSIEISDKAVQKVQTMLKDELNESSIITHNIVLNPNKHEGFSTAGGKTIKVSDKAIQQVQTMLKNELNEISTGSQDNIVINPNLCKGFATAGGKSIKVSDVALKKVQTLLKDEFNEVSTVSQDNIVINPNLCKGFATAGGKSIKVSDVALKKVQTILKDELNEVSTVSQDNIVINPNLCKGFATAGGKSIKVSDEALKKVQTILNDEYSSSVMDDKTNSKSNVYNQFLNGEDKSIKESDNSLKKNQLTFKDDTQLFDSSLETVAISSVCSNSNKGSKLTNDLKTKSNCFEILKQVEENTFEDDLSLINTVEKFERDQIICNPVLRNKRPGSPINTQEINYKIKKTVYNGGWEIDELNTSFSVYLSNKLNGPKVSLPKVVDWVLPKICSIKQFPENGVAKELIKLNVDNAIHLKLYWEKNYKSSGGHKNKMYNFQDLKHLFLSHSFVDGKLIPKGWIENHFRFIVWKLAATEISFPDHFGNKLLTAKNIIHQLLYRYYREIEKCQRSALKKILEKDETTSKRIILCVSKVNKTDLAETFTIELTDGWYSVQGIIDYEMNMLLHKGIIKVGTKLIIYNAELIGAGEGIDPLDVHDSVKLKISTNSTRRVRWYAKLGFYKNSTLPIPITLESVLPHGGIIGSLSLVILRKYPIMFLEKKTNSKSIFRNEKMETIESEKYKAYQQKSLEIISNKIKTELITEMASKTKVSKKYFSSMKKENLDKLSIEELSNIIDNSTDPLEIQSLLSQEKLEALKGFKNSEQERFYNELQNRVNKVFNDQFKDSRKVIPMIKLRVVDEKYVSTGFKAALLTIWNPSEDVTEILNKSTEGQCCTLHHITTNGFMNGELQLSANKNTRFDFQGYKNEYVKRDVVCFKSICSGTFLPLFGELDLVGIVVSDVNKNNAYNEIYVSDKEMNIISILFRGNIKEYGYDDMMYPGSIISGINIQFKGFNQISPIPKLYNTEQSLFSTIPKTEYILNIFNDYKMFMKKPENQNFLICCQAKLSEICNRHGETTTINNEQCLNKSRNALHKSYSELPVAVVRTSGTSQSEFSPAQKRIKMLNAFGKTPPLNIVHTKPPDKKLMGQFKTPTRL